MRLAPRLIDEWRSDGVDWSCAVDRYDGRMKEIIHALKYERRRSIAPPLGELMRITGARLLADADVVVPVPLHRRREYQRGFNQAEDLASHLGPPLTNLLVRTRHTPSQIELPKEERHLNVKGAFALNNQLEGWSPPVWRRDEPLSSAIKIAVLVDDVSTTGSTLNACARVLKAAGVKEVRAVTAARVVNERR